jgi:hypothetical protein
MGWGGDCTITGFVLVWVGVLTGEVKEKGVNLYRIHVQRSPIK